MSIQSSIKSFFFFQAEDGIRDADVTGVQTCALPIFKNGILNRVGILKLINHGNRKLCANYIRQDGSVISCQCRSEERRVGKECRSGWGLYGYSEKDNGRRRAEVISEYR